MGRTKAIQSTSQEVCDDTRKIKRIGRKVGNLVAAMLGVSITLVVVLCVLMFYRLTMSMMQNECVPPFPDGFYKWAGQKPFNPPVRKYA